MSKRRAILPIVAFAGGLLAIVALTAILLAPSGEPQRGPGIGGPFTLVDQDGRVVTERSLAGSTHLVFFGFTHCPDVCPTTLQQISDVLGALGAKADRLKVVFISVDPQRDTPETLKTYLASFDRHITGLTGSTEQVAQAVKAYRAYARKVPANGGDYTMEHTALVYVMDKRNAFVTALNLARPPQETAAELSRRL